MSTSPENLVPAALIAENKSDPIRRIALALNTLNSEERAHNLSQVITAIREDDTDRLAVNRPDDIVAAAAVGEGWESRVPVPVGESGTLFRIFSYFDEDEYQTWHSWPHRTFLRTGTLRTRPITPAAEIYRLPQAELLKVDNGTSQYATAAVLCGDSERLANAPYRLQQTYDIYDSWLGNGRQLDWSAPLIEDETIRLQAEAMARLALGKGLDFEVRHSEDVPLGIAFGLISLDEAAQRFPSVIGHESNRIVEMRRGLELYKNGVAIDSPDHRVVQALTLLALAQEKPITVTNLGCVAKSWPLFYDFVSFLKAQ